MTRHVRSLHPIVLLFTLACLLLPALAATTRFGSTPAHAETTYVTIHYGAGYGYTSDIVVLSNSGWHVTVADTTGSPVATLVFQGDCNLVEYRDVNHVRTVTWASGTVEPYGYVCGLRFQVDGNVVITHSYPLWATGTNKGKGPKYDYVIFSSGENDIWYYVTGYGWVFLWTKP
jgi:hypothetical protein